MGGTWNWIDGDGGLERTGFNGNVKWIEVNFYRQNGSTFRDPYVRMSSVGFIPKGMGRAETFMDDVKRQMGNVKDIAADVEKAVKSGCNSVTDIVKTVKCARGEPVC